MTDRSRIDADLDDVRLSPDGSRLILLLRDAAGQEVSLSMPTHCLSTLLAAAPQPAATGPAHPVETWNIVLAENGQDMILTLCTTKGTTTSFAIKSWQAQGIATVTTYATTREGPSRSVH